jgi:hypothetical protein
MFHQKKTHSNDLYKRQSLSYTRLTFYDEFSVIWLLFPPSCLADFTSPGSRSETLIFGPIKKTKATVRIIQPD